MLKTREHRPMEKVVVETPWGIAFQSLSNFGHTLIIKDDPEVREAMLVNEKDFIKLKNRAMAYRGPNSFSKLIFHQGQVSYDSIPIQPALHVKFRFLHTSVHHRIKLKRSVFSQKDLSR